MLGLHIVRGDNICVVSGAHLKEREHDRQIALQIATVRCRWARSTRISTSVLIFTTSRSIALHNLVGSMPLEIQLSLIVLTGGAPERSTQRFGRALKSTHESTALLINHQDNSCCPIDAADSEHCLAILPKSTKGNHSYHYVGILMRKHYSVLPSHPYLYSYIQ